MAFLGVDLLDFYRGTMSVRRLRVLLEHLPPESATKTALRNAITPEDLAAAASSDYRPEEAPWSSVAILLAAIKDEITLARSVAISAAGGKPPPFVPTARPGVSSTSTKPKRLSDEQRRAIDPRLRNQP